MFLLLDRIVLDADIRARVVDAVESGYREAGEVIFETAPRDGGEPPSAGASRNASSAKPAISNTRSPSRACFPSTIPFGACPRCQGFGNTIDFDMDLVIPDPSKTLAEGAIEPWTKPKYKPLATEMKRYARQARIPLDVPWSDLDQEHRRLDHGRRRQVVLACAASSSIWSARNTSCTCASF